MKAFPSEGAPHIKSLTRKDSSGITFPVQSFKENFFKEVGGPMLYEPYEFAFFVLIYSFIGWGLETLVYSFSQRKLVNAGFLTLPFILSHGLTMAILAGVLPTFGTNLFFQYLNSVHCFLGEHLVYIEDSCETNAFYGDDIGYSPHDGC